MPYLSTKKDAHVYQKYLEISVSKEGSWESRLGSIDQVYLHYRVEDSWNAPIAPIRLGIGSLTSKQSQRL